MDSFLRLYAIYRSTSRWQIVARVYSESKLIWRITMWATKVAFVVLAGIGLFAESWLPFYWAILIAAAIWATSFNKARAEVFSIPYQLYPERIKYFGKDYQYIRYLTFRERLESSSFAGSVVDALAFIDDQINTDSHSSVTSHPFISFTLAALLAIVGGVAGQWSAQYAAILILILIFVLYFSYMVLGFTRTPQSDLKEFKRFLLWAKDDQSVR